MPKNSGFTLIELLVTITIIAVLASIGGVVYRNTADTARQTKKREDVEAIAKAYEQKYTVSQSYSTLSPQDFTQGSIPKTPSNTDYTFVRGPDASPTETQYFAVCANLAADTPCSIPSQTCYCKSNSQGTPVSQAGGGGGGGGGSNPSCDPFGVLTNGLAGYWKFDGNLEDFSANNLDGAAGGSPAYVNGKSPIFGNALSLNGISDYVSVANNPLITSIPAGGSVTYSVWVNTSDTTTSDYPNILGIRSFIGGNNLFNLRTFIGRLELEVYDPTQSTTLRYTNIVDGQWHHIVAIKDVNTIRMYVDTAEVTGSPDTSKTWQTISQPGPFYIGTRDVASFYQGYLDDLRIYNRALSPTEIASLYNECLP